MCLDARYPKIFCFRRTIGYKIVDQLPELPGEYKGLYQKNHYIENRWYNADNRTLEANTLLGYIDYPSGFHIYLNRRRTIAYQDRFIFVGHKACVVKVEFADVCAFGLNDGLSTVVAKKMKVIERIK